MVLKCCSGLSGTMWEAPGLALAQLPASLVVSATYGMAVLTDNSDALKLAVFMVSEQGKAILARHELGPIGEP